MAEITQIERLHGKNYQLWKYNAKFVLMERGLWGFVEGTETVPAAATVTRACKSIFPRRPILVQLGKKL